jgi:CHASE1-domain containing sensor protein
VNRTVTDARPYHRVREAGVFASVFVSIVVIGVGVGVLVQDRRITDFERSTDISAARVEADIQSSLGLTLERLAGAAGLVTVGGSVSPAQFARFADGITDNPAVTASALNLVVANEDREFFEAAIGGPIFDRAANGTATRAPDRPTYAPVAAVFPDTEQTRVVIGYDHLAEPRRRLNLERARSTGAPIVSDPVVLTSGDDGFFLVTALFPLDRQPGTADGAGGAPIGFINVAYLSESFADSLAMSTGLDILRVEMDGATLADRSGSLELAREVQTQIADRTWTVFFRAGARPSWIPSAAVVVTAVLLAALVVELMRRSARYRRDLEIWSRALAVQQQRTEGLRLVTAELAEATTVDDVCRIALDRGVPLVDATWGHLTVNAPDGGPVETRETGPTTHDRNDHGSDHPLTAGGRGLGVLRLGTDVSSAGDTSTAHPSGDQMEMRRLLARLTSDALARTQERQNEHELAEALQMMLLPELPGSLGSDSVCGIYRPLRSSSVGGDWYDAFSTPGGNAYLVGDVVGKGIRAAGAMGNLRLATHLVHEAQHPDEILTALDAVAERVPDAFLTTAAVVVADLERREVRVARAGHPPPLLLSRDGVVTWLLDGGGPPLGMPDSAPRRASVMPWTDGMRLVLYTDGLLERRSESIDTGFRRLADAVSEFAWLPLTEFCEAVVDALVAEDQRDDVALLAVDLAAP